MKDKKIIIILTSIIVVIALVIVLLLINGNKKDEDTNKEKDNNPKTVTTLLDLEEYKDLKVEKVNKIIRRRYTVAGMDEETITNQAEIDSLFDLVTSIKIGEETYRACEDNTTVYVFEQDNKSFKVEIECEWLVVGKKRYTIER